MDRILRPDKFDCDPTSSTATKEWKHWLRSFTAFINSIPGENINKLDILINFVSSSVYELIKECEDFQDAIATLDKSYVKPKNIIFSRHLLATCKQEIGQTVDTFFQQLKKLSLDCDFKSVTAEQHREEAIRDALITGILSPSIRQRLLEKIDLNLQSAYDFARSLETAQKNSDAYSLKTEVQSASISKCKNEESLEDCVATTYSSKPSSKPNESCFFCGYTKHRRIHCPAREATCKSCGKVGHFSKVCRSSKKVVASIASSDESFLATVASSALSKAVVPVFINGKHVSALLDTGSTESFIDSNTAKDLRVRIENSTGSVRMASTSFATKIKGICRVNLQFQDRSYNDYRLTVLSDLCSDIILGQDFMREHESLTLNFGGDKSPLKVCGLAKMDIEAPPLFSNTMGNPRPIAIKSRRHSSYDLAFIREEVERLLKEDIIETSTSPWRAQVLVTSGENRKRRMVIDYSQTINRYTQLDAYPIPCINDLVNRIAKYKVFSKLDLRSAYHQVPIRVEDRIYTGFEAAGNLFQFKRIPFGVTNGVAAFQRVIDQFIKENKLQKTFAYLDDVTVCGDNQADHDSNLHQFMEAAKKRNLTLNEAKCSFNQTSINILGFVISNGEKRPDPERIKPLRDLQLPKDAKSLQRVIGLFSHYSQWIKGYSEKIRPLLHSKVFPMGKEAEEAFENLKSIIEKSVLKCINENESFVVETDASDYAIGATLNQNNRPVAFYSRTLSNSEKKHSSIEKEAYAIVESLRKWRHFLSGRHFTLITDQKSISFMFDPQRSGKIKNDKIQRWRLELASYNFDISYRAGTKNIIADAFSRPICSALTLDNLRELHTTLCHPGITRMSHFIRMRNLPYSIEEIRQVIRNCKICSECKPNFFRKQSETLIKATQPFERLSLDFKGPIPSSSSNKYILTIVDEYSRFPFAYPCSDISSRTVIKSLRQLFAIFGMPSYIHTDRGASFMSAELKQFLTIHGVSTSRTTPYNPRGNGQVERYNGIIWRTINLALKSLSLPVTQWESVLPAAMHSIRSLLCTNTNETPHERMFKYARRSVNGQSTPSWLLTPGPVLLKQMVRQSKYDPLVEEVELLHANPSYAHIRDKDGVERTVSVRHLAPTQTDFQQEITQQLDFPLVEKLPNVTVRPTENYPISTVTEEKPSQEARQEDIRENNLTSPSSVAKDVQEDKEENPTSKATLRRSTRVRKAPDRYKPS